MSFDDMRKHFTDFEICSVSVDELYEDDSGMYNTEAIGSVFYRYNGFLNCSEELE